MSEPRVAELTDGRQQVQDVVVHGEGEFFRGAAMGRLIEEWTAKGKLISTEPLTPRDHCARVRFADGAFPVSEESVRAGGFAFLNAGSKEEAIELCKAFLKVAGPGTCELRLILQFAPQPA